MLRHHNPIGNTKKDTLINIGYHNRIELIELINDYNVDMILSGHVHFDNVTIKNNTIFVTTTTPESEIRVKDGYWGYRLISIKDGDILSYNYKEPKYSIPSYKIDIKYKNSTSAIVTNELDKDITVLVKFFTPKNSYKIVNGTIEMIRENNYSQEYYVKVDIPSNTSVNSYLKQS